MKVLIVGQYYYPDNFKINEISYEMAKSGYDVTVLTGLPDYATGKIPNEYKWFKNRDTFQDGIHVIRVPIIARRKGAFWRVLNYASFLINSTIRVTFLKKDFDAIFCYQVSPITMVNAALKAKKRSNKKLFLYCLDLWPESLKAWKIQENSLIFKMMMKYSQKIYQSCDVIGITSLPFQQYFTQTIGIDEAKIVYLPQHADDIKSIASLINREPAAGDCINFAFSGNIGKLQDVECIIHAVYRMRDVANFMVHIYGNGSDFLEVQTLAQQLGVIDKVRFYGRIDKNHLHEEYQKIDVFLITLKQEGYIGMTMPSKLQEYMSAGKPIIAAIGGAAAQVIQEAGCGIISAPSDDYALMDNMRKYIQNPENYKELGDKAYAFYKQNFTKEIFMSKLDKILENIQ